MATPMNYRSTNATGYKHLGHALVVGVEEGYGVEINPVSTGVAAGPNIISAGDDANIGLTISAKGTGALTLTGTALTLTSTGAMTVGGTSTNLALGSTLVVIGSTTGQVQVAGSTAPWGGFIRFTDTAVATPNFATTNAMVMETTHVIAGVNSSHFIVANGVNLSTDCALLNAYAGSTAGDVHCRFAKVSTLTVGASTATINFLVVRF